MDQENLPPHVLIFPLPLQGPVNSMFKLAELLCLSKIHVTFVVTDYIYSRLIRFSDIKSRFDRYPGFQIKTLWDGLPEDHPHAGDQFMEMFNALKSQTKPLFKDMLVSGDRLSSATRRPVNCIIADGILGFTCDVAIEVGIPIIHVRTLSACCIWLFFCLDKIIEAGELPFKDNDLDTLIKSVPGMESFLRRRDLPSFCRLGDLSNMDVQLFKTEGQENARAYGVILNTFEELEAPILDQMRTVCANLYPIGPLHGHLKTKLVSGTGSEEPSSSNSLWEEDKNCITWLDKQPARSVIYVSFGSIATLTKDQLMEFWHGIVNSGIRFLWVIRPDSIAGEDGQKNTPSELTQATEERGYIAGWVPQEKVLAHPAVGGFLTHSGWNSTLETISEGVPMICWPYFLDQQVNSRFVEAVWKLGLDMKDTCDRVVVEKTVRALMVERRDEFVENAESMAKLAKACLREGGSSYRNMERLIKDIEAMATKARDFNGFDIRLLDFLLGHGDSQHTVLHAGLDLINLGVLRKPEAAEEPAGAPLDAVPRVVLVLLLPAPLTADLEDPAFLHLHLDLLLLETREVGLEHVGLRRLLPVHPGGGELGRVTADRRGGGGGGGGERVPQV